MSSEDNKALVRRWFEAVDRRDSAVVREFIAPDYVDHNPPPFPVLANARLLDRHRLAVLLHGAPVAPVLDALRAYRNPDGGFGHALEPESRE